MMFGSQLAAFEEQVQEYRTKNLQLIEEEVGRGFQAVLIGLAVQAKSSFTTTEMSNLARGARGDDGRRRCEFTNSRARSIERALDLPRGSFDLPPWQFSRHLPMLWEYPTRAGSNREWFDRMLVALLEVPPRSPTERPARARSDAMEEVLARLRAKASGD
jgi:hypothetical protein